ncbi:hypothetical protein Tco_0073196 [Tanacetum coccineum]
MNILEEIFRDLGYRDGRILFTHFRIHWESLDEDLLTLMSDEVYIETGVLLVERHMMERMMSMGKGVVIEEIVDHDVVGKEFDSESGNSGKLRLLEWNQSI